MNDETQYRLGMFEYINKRFDLYYEFTNKMIELNRPHWLPGLLLAISLIACGFSNIYNAVCIEKLNTKIIALESHNGKVESRR